MSSDAAALDDQSCNNACWSEFVYAIVLCHCPTTPEFLSTVRCTRHDTAASTWSELWTALRTKLCNDTHSLTTQQASLYQWLIDHPGCMHQMRRLAICHLCPERFAHLATRWCTVMTILNAASWLLHPRQCLLSYVVRPEFMHSISPTPLVSMSVLSSPDLRHVYLDMVAPQSHSFTNSVNRGGVDTLRSLLAVLPQCATVIRCSLFPSIDTIANCSAEQLKLHEDTMGHCLNGEKMSRLWTRYFDGLPIEAAQQADKGVVWSRQLLVESLWRFCRQQLTRLCEQALRDCTTGEERSTWTSACQYLNDASHLADAFSVFAQLFRRQSVIPWPRVLQLDHSETRKHIAVLYSAINNTDGQSPEELALERHLSLSGVYDQLKRCSVPWLDEIASTTSFPVRMVQWVGMLWANSARSVLAATLFEMSSGQVIHLRVNVSQSSTTVTCLMCGFENRNSVKHSLGHARAAHNIYIANVMYADTGAIVAQCTRNRKQKKDKSKRTRN